ncbi:MAG: glycosyltransferase family 39 protein [bacterium]|nr:glycosyltransferase family 39 protein [bacterium]
MTLGLSLVQQKVFLEEAVRSKFLLLILALGLLLRVISINQSLWLDEAISVNAARNFSVVELLTKFSPGDFHPPFHYLLLKGWGTVFGFSEVAARSLSVLFGVATIWLVFLMGKNLFNKKTGLISVLFLATAPLHIYYSQEARMYVPATFFAIVVVLFFLKLIGKNGDNLINWLGFILSGIALLYTDYLPGFIFVPLALYLFVFEKQHLRVNAKKWAVSFVAIVLLFAFWLPTFLQQLQVGLAVKINAPEWWSVLGRTSLKQLALVPLKFTIGRIPVDSSYNHVGALTVTSIVFAGLFYKAAKLWEETKFLWLWILAPAIAIAILGLGLSVFSYFRLLFLLPAFYLLLAVGSLSFRNRKVQALVVFVVIGINLAATSIYLFNPRFHREDWRSATSWIQEHSGDKAATLFVGKGQIEPYRYYNPGIPAFGPTGWEDGGFDTIFLMRYVQPILDPQDTLRQKVEGGGYRKLGEHDFNGVVVWEYQK